mgnify:CR=1 FL=1
MSSTSLSHPSAGERRAPIDDAGPGRGDLLVSVLYPSIWLIFLAFPVSVLLSSDHTAGAKALGLLGFAVFAGVYVLSWWHPHPLEALGPRAMTGLWLLALVACLLALVPLLGGSVLASTPFLSALLVFRLSRREALIGVAVLALGVLGVLVLIWPQHLGWAIPAFAMSTLLMLAIRLVIDREDQTRAVAEQLQLSQQREAIGRDVHDLLGHSLTVITLKTELARRLLEQDPTRAAAELDEVLRLSREASAEVRLAVGRLHSPEWPAQIASARTALEAAQISAELPAAESVPADQQPLLAWCLREAVTNVVRHSGASRCVVHAEPGRLVVEDDGIGLPEERGAGSGLRGLSERVQQAGGQLSLGPSRLGAPCDRPGTRLEVMLPRAGS